LEIEDIERPPELPAYDAERDIAPRKPQFIEHLLQARERGTAGRSGLPVIVGPLTVGCDRSGACCSQYPVIPATPEDSRRAIETLHRLEPDRPHATPPSKPATPPLKLEDAFAPAALGRRDLLTPVLQGDGCSFLTGEGCRIHQVGGAEAKPWTCRQYPLQVIHCGDAFEVSILPQCACAARTVRRAGPQTSAGEWPADPLQGLTTVPQIPERVAVDEGRSIPRAAYLKWARALADVLATPGVDPARVLGSAAESLGISDAALTGPWLETLKTRMLSEAERLETYLDPAGPQPKATRWVSDVAAVLSRGRRPAPVPAPWDGMVFSLALRAHLLLELPFLSAALCDLARLARLAGLARAVTPVETVDPRLETTTVLLYLWATTRWPVASEALVITSEVMAGVAKGG
ncbi:MAG TPA: hypothetical protein VNO21_05280, partial [Polyangiaceae bacterium]|nr:hypothetical protein [Polyangiaceae bacterium]